MRLYTESTNKKCLRCGLKGLSTDARLVGAGWVYDGKAKNKTWFCPQCQNERPIREVGQHITRRGCGGGRRRLPKPPL
jgi:hypothetical protein